MERTAFEPLAIVDVQYSESGANAACVVGEHWAADTAIEQRQVCSPDVEPYVPGEFYRREMPPILGVLSAVTTPFEVIVVDSYVVLDEHGTPGLGARLYEHFEQRYAVIGVAKTAYRGSSFAVPVSRGTSRRLLYVTALGISQELAAERVSQMHGNYRVPTLIRLADQLARGR